MNNIVAAVDALDRQQRAALELLRTLGWHTFGTHVDRPDLKLEFSRVCDQTGLPYFERVVQ
jgi:hypothetical protein